jgi:hypothetical protein
MYGRRIAPGYSRNCQTSTATPAEPGEHPRLLASRHGILPLIEAGKSARRVVGTLGAAGLPTGDVGALL